MKYKIIIPTYRRSDNLLTLEYLSKCGIAKKDIYLLISDEFDYNLYKKNCAGYNIIYDKKLANLKEKHNYIIDKFDEGDNIVVIEDDIKELVKKKGSKVIPFYNLKELIKIGFYECYKNNVRLFGITPTDNGFFMSNKSSVCTKIIGGYFFGFILDKRIKVNVSQKHDYERTILNNIYHGGSFRFDMIGQRSKSFTNEGGLQSVFTKKERQRAELSTNNFLLQKYPNYVAKKKRYNKVLGGQTELRLL